MKKTFKSIIKRNLELLPVFVPIIMSLSSWTLYKVINKNEKNINSTTVYNQHQNILKINCDFLKPINKDNSDQHSTNKQNDKISSVINNHLSTNENLSVERLNPTYEPLLNKYNSNLIKAGYVGEIGNLDPERRDVNAADNIFDVQVLDLNLTKSYILKYDIDGYSGVGSATRSINGSYAMGGYFKNKNNGWTEVSEYIDPSILKKGNNKVLFNALNKGDYYTVKNVRIEQRQHETSPYTIVSKIYTDKAVYIRGFVNPKFGIKAVNIHDERLNLHGNEFEYVSKINTEKDHLSIKFEGINSIPDYIVEKKDINVSFTDTNSASTLEHNIIFSNYNITIKGLRMIDLPPFDLSTTNISNQYEGFRLLNYSSKEQKFNLSYDKNKIPKGYQESDINAFSFDYDKREWVPVKIDSLNTVKNTVTIYSSLGSSDLMLGVVKQPESPEGGGHAQTSFNDSPIANPASKMNLIAPPKPNQQGSANVSYPIEIPSGVGGFQPKVSLVYNSDNKFGWAGTGWDVPVETIDIDTRWGVPSFANHESEIYLIAGEQLVFKDDYLPNKLPYDEVRVSDRRFYYRNGIKEGYTITRKGNSPSNYTWETLDGNGTKKEYSYVLTTNASSNSSGNIIKWFLSKVTDRFGNTIIYSYTDTFDGGGKNKYLSKISYSNNTVIEFENEGGIRGDMTLNYKLGVKLTDTKILNRITVKRANLKIREYQLVNNSNGLFAKRLLTEIIQKDADGNVFNQHALRYTNSLDIFDKSVTHVYHTPKDNNDAGSFSGGNTSFISGTYSKNKNIRGALSFGGGFCFLFGIDKKGTLGATASYDDNQAYGKNQLVDIDGDGLLDKVFYASNGNISFRKNIRTDFSGVYSSTGLSDIPLHRHNTYSTTLGLEYSFANGVVGANYSFGNSNSPTYFSDVNGDGLVDMINYGDVFFNKIRNGAPQFQSQPQNSTFNVTEETPNAILAGNAARQDTIITTTVSKSLANVVRMWEAPVAGNIRISNQILLTQNSQDGVELWIEKGAIRKSDEDISGFNPLNSSVISPVITLNNQVQFQGLNATTYVEKGQRIFIVASSRASEIGDRVRVDSDIQYNAVSGVTDLDLKDANNNDYFKFNAKSHYLASSQKQNMVADQSRVSISWDKLDSSIFTDDVDFKIYMSVRNITDTTSVISPSNATLLYHHKLLKDSNQNSVIPSSNQIPNIDITDFLVNSSGRTATMFHFDVSADTNVSWEKIRWRPVITVKNPIDTTDVYALVQYNPYSERLINTLPKDFRKYSGKQVCDIKDDCPRCGTDTSFLFPDFNGNQSTTTNYTINLPSLHNTTVTFSLKIKDSNGDVYTEKNTVNVVNNVMQIPKISLCKLLSKIRMIPEEVFTFPFYFEISSADYVVAKKLSSVNPYIYHSQFLADPNLANTDHKADYFGFRSGNIHYNINTGLIYQGWGGFSYNGSKYPNEPIREGEFSTNPLANVPAPGGASPCNPNDPDYYICMTNYIIQQNNNRYFTPLQLDAEKYTYVSPLEPVELGEDGLQSYLLGVSSTSSTVTTTPLFAVPNPRGIILRSTFDSFHAYASGSIIPFLGISAHGGISTDKTSDYFQDFNGDGYPDIISGRFYQKTNVLGQLDNVSSIAEKEVKSRGYILGAGISASASVAKFSNTDSKFFAIGAEKDSHTGSSSFGLGVGAGINIGKAWAEGTGVWADLNGDGLTDYISGGNSYINTGNGFSVDNYSWNVSEVSKGDSFALSGGGGFSFANGSWAAGIGLSKSSYTAKTGMIDVNGDGMADKIVKNGNTYEVWINTGTSFMPPNNFNRDFSLDNKQNSSGFNLYGTLCACLGVKVCISVGGGTDKSVSKQEVDLRDFDGDGYPDLLISENDSELTYYRNKFGKANLLHTIENSLQGLIMIEYDNVNQSENLATLVGGTYQMPFSKTVMSKIGVWNFRPIDTTLPYLGNVLDPQKIKPQQRFHFQYEKGIQDRREREFLGFGIVTTKVYNDQTLHQTHVTQYETDYTGSENNFYVNFNDTRVRQYYYKKGLIRSTFMLDNQNRKRTETKYTYKYFDRILPEYAPEESQPDPQFKDIGRIIPLLYKTESSFTEYVGSNSHTKTTIQTIGAYDKYGNITRTTDRGATLSVTSDDILTEISYHPPGIKNIVGIPSQQIVVTVHNNDVVRKTTTIIDAEQNITRISKDLLGTSPVSGTADFDMEYDTYGNMTKITYPESENGQRMFYEYNYDPLYHTYLISTIDAHGFTSSTKYDNNYLFGVPIEITNINGGTGTYVYDTFGRLTEYLAPSDTDFTVRLHYFPSNIIPVAITERKPFKYDKDIRPNYFTSLFTDAWGQGMMIKKLFKEDNGTYYFANNIYQIEDKLGRPVKTIIRDKVTTGTDIMASLKVFDDYTTAENDAAQIYSTTVYDELDRPLSITQHNVTTNNGVQSLTTQMNYGFDSDRYGNTQFATEVVSPLGNTNVSHTDEYGRTVSTRQTDGNNNIWVSYQYNRLNELVSMEDAGNNPTLYEYDKLGRTVRKTSPDSGISDFSYDLSGKLIKSSTAVLGSYGQQIHYKYNYDQLREVNYPFHPGFISTFEYGEQNGSPLERGRLIKQTDRTGTQEFKHDIDGNVVENVRVVVAPRNVPKKFKTSYTYDTFGRIKKIIYPDAEIVTYDYGISGLLINIGSALPGASNGFSIANSMVYDNRDQMLSYNAGNDTKTNYNYNPWGTVDELSLSYLNNTNIRTNHYVFDGNENLVNVESTTLLNGLYPSHDLGIAASKQYSYDSFGRLGTSQITAKGKEMTKYNLLNMTYNNVGAISVKNSKLKTYQNLLCASPENEGEVGTYSYTDLNHPNALTAIDYTKFENFTGPLDCGQPTSDPLTLTREEFQYDLNGNLTTMRELDSHSNLLSNRKMFWNEENQLKAVVIDDENLNYYVYDAAGDRILKNDAVKKTLYTNGNNADEVTQMGKFAYYPNGYFVVSNDNMSKHYYMGGQRIATRIGKLPSHRFKADLYGIYDELAVLLEEEVNDIIKNVGLLPAAWSQNEDSVGSYTPPPYNLNNTVCSKLIEFQIYTFYLDKKEDCYNKLLDLYSNTMAGSGNFCDAWTQFLNDECMAGYPVPEVQDSNIYWIHPDHFSGASILTDAKGNITHWYEYMPFGEMLMENTNLTYDNPYKYNAKEFDMATGYYYYGARYYDPRRSVWLSVDPLADITNSPYAYVWNDPVNFTDPTGLMGERVGGPKDGPKTIKDCFGTNDDFDMFSRKPGDPRTVQVYQYSVVKSANGWNVYRNSQLDKTVTRIEGKNWKGAEESHFSVLKNDKWIDYDSYADFSKDYPKHTLQGMPAKEIAQLSWSSTKEVARIAWESEESRAVLLMPVAIIEELVVLRYAAPVLRSRYIEEVGSLNLYGRRMISAGSTKEEVATTLHGLRRSIGEKYKSITPPDMLEKIYQRNMEKYGDKLGPTIDYLRKQGKSWDDIIESSSRAGGKDLGLKGSKK